MSQTHNHHLGISAIAIVPVALLLLATRFGPTAIASDIEHFSALADRKEQELTLLDIEFRNMQEAYNLIKHGKKMTTYKSLRQHYASEVFDSEFDRFTTAKRYVAALTERRNAYKTYVNRVADQAVHIDLSDQKLSLVQNGEIIATYPVSSGAPHTPTPRGTFQIHRKQTLRISQQETPYRMPYYMAFTKSQSHGMHALPYLGAYPGSSGYWQEAESNIGNPVSHGCVRLLPEDAETVYEWIEIGTPVHIDA